jgi:hypothetical protein
MNSHSIVEYTLLLGTPALVIFLLAQMSSASRQMQARHRADVDRNFEAQRRMLDENERRMAMAEEHLALQKECNRLLAELVAALRKGA